MTTATDHEWRLRYGPWAVITGASSGIGEAIAREIAARGVNIVLVARRGDILMRLAAELSGRHGVEARAMPANLAHDAGTDALISAIDGLDVGLFVAGAGFGTSGLFLDASLAAEREMLDINCRAVLVQTAHFASRLAARGRGGIILLGSLVARQGTPYTAHYAATKAYVQTLGEALAVELAIEGVDVLVSAPGPVHSGFADRAGMRMGAAVTPAIVARATVAALGTTHEVVPGALSKLLTYSLAPLPRALRTRIMGGVMRGMTRHQERVRRP